MFHPWGTPGSKGAARTHHVVPSIPRPALRVRDIIIRAPRARQDLRLNYIRSNVTNVTSVRSNNTITSCNSNTTSTPLDPSCLTQHTTDEVIKLLNLSTNIQGGYFRQTFEDPDKVPGSNRSLSTSNFYLIVYKEAPRIGTD
ncbi:hypothetical protein E4U52_004791 [Claviceps spartinae]|nr:hypothetical protein E4U52_004791 [Claviceps spartinae]